MKKKIYFIDSSFSTTQEEVRQYLEKRGLFDGYAPKHPWTAIPLFSYLRTKPMTKMKLEILLFRFNTIKRHNPFRYGSVVRAYEAVK